MFSVTVRDRFMVAHSFSGDFFGPAQRLHGATYVVDATLHAETLDSHGVVADIGALSHQLRSVLSELDYRNLDDLPEFAGMNTTTEVLAKSVADRLADAAVAGSLGVEHEHLLEVEVTLHESDVARAGYRRPVAGPT
jgi:6-pyruvoyl-tetrahydropterin synthase